MIKFQQNGNIPVSVVMSGDTQLPEDIKITINSTGNGR